MLTAGSVVSGYRIRRLLGSGGMGAVYLADDPNLPRPTALKVLSAELSRDPDFRARFIREADTAAALEHPQIVSVYNRGHTDDDQLWIAMQFVDGTDADDALRAGTMTPPVAGPPQRAPKRRRRTVIGAALGAVVLIAATVTAIAWPQDTTPGTGTTAGPPPRSAPAPPSAQSPEETTIAEPQLRSILLSATEILTTHGNAVVLETDSSKLFNDVAPVEDRRILAASA
jgi:hypothetical protein